MASRRVKESDRGTRLSTLTDQQRVFVAELTADENFSGTKAAEKAGYKNPSAAAYRLFKNPRINRAIGKSLKRRIDRCNVTADQVLYELAIIGFSDLTDLMDDEGYIDAKRIKTLPPEIRRSLGSIEIESTTDREGNTITKAKVKLHNKQPALELLAKHLGMLDVKFGLAPESANLIGEVLKHVEERSKVIDGEYVKQKAKEG